MQAQFVHIHISMETTITFMIHIVMKGKSPPSIMCATATNNIYYELKHDNGIMNMKMLDTQTYKSEQALNQASANHHEHMRRPRYKHLQEEATATTITSASSPSVIKASSPFNVQHLRLPPTSTPTSTSSPR